MKTPKGVNSMIEIQLIDEAHKKDIRLKNDSFPLYGRLVPSYNGKQWSYTTQKFPPEECGEMTFPDEPYDYDKMAECTFFVGAYAGERCVGLAVLERSFFKYLYLSDLKVASGCRGKGVGRMLIERCMEIAKEQKMQGVSLTVQDNNLSACLFYLKVGFRIGGLDTETYNGTSQEGKADIEMYRDVSC